MTRKKLSAVVGGSLCAAFAYTAYASTSLLSGQPISPSSPVTVVQGASLLNNLSASPAALASAHATALIGQVPAGGEFFSFGVQTHFSQGWSPSWLKLADQVGARTLRDTVNWASVEQKPGVYNFGGTAVQTLDSFCASKGKLILTIEQKNSLYDGADQYIRLQDARPTPRTLMRCSTVSGPA